MDRRHPLMDGHARMPERVLGFSRAQKGSSLVKLVNLYSLKVTDPYLLYLLSYGQFLIFGSHHRLIIAKWIVWGMIN